MSLTNIDYKNGWITINGKDFPPFECKNVEYVAEPEINSDFSIEGIKNLEKAIYCICNECQTFFYVLNLEIPKHLIEVVKNAKTIEVECPACKSKVRIDKNMLI